MLLRVQIYLAAASTCPLRDISPSTPHATVFANLIIHSLPPPLNSANVDNDELQAQLTDEMVELARGLKEQSMLASGILKEDAEV